MKRLILIAPAAMAVYFLSRALVPADAEWVTFRVEVLAAAALAAVGCALAARRLQPGDYLRAAWSANFAGYCLITLAALMRFPHQPPRGLSLARGAVLVGENAFQVISMWLFSRAFRVAGITLPGSQARKVLIAGAAAFLALVIAGSSFEMEARRLVSGEVTAIAGVVSSIGDIITFTLIGPIFMTALALRGGLLVWPWSLITASGLSWLLHDAQNVVARYLPQATARDVAAWADIWRISACVLVLAAGLAQRRLSSQPQTA